MSRLTKKREQRTWILSIIIGLILMIIAIPFYTAVLTHIADVDYSDKIIVENLNGENTTISLYVYNLNDVYTDEIVGLFDIIDITAFMIFGSLIFPALMYTADRKWREDIDNHVPSLLREVSDAQKTGLPLPKAIIEASKHQYGALTPELKKMAAKISWGIPFSDALKGLTKATDTELMKRTTLLILEAERSGGAIEDVFESAHKHVSETLGLKRERLSSMKPYTWIIYAAFIVFILVIIMLMGTFFIGLANQIVDAEPTAGEGNEVASLPFNVAGLELVFYHLIIIEGLFAGLIAGKMGEGDPKIGIRHSCILLVISYIAFKVSILLF